METNRMSSLVKVLSIVSCILFAQEDFFEPGYSIGGYGELHYNRTQTGNNDTTKLDFHRFIIYYCWKLYNFPLIC